MKIPAILEADAAFKTLLVDKATAPQQLRVIKRCKMIVDVLNRLEPDLAILMNDSFLYNNTHCSNSAALGQGDSFYGMLIVINFFLFRNKNYDKVPFLTCRFLASFSIERFCTAT